MAVYTKEIADLLRDFEDAETDLHSTPHKRVRRKRGNRRFTREQKYVRTALFNNVLVATNIGEYLFDVKDVCNFAVAIKADVNSWVFLHDRAVRILNYACTLQEMRTSGRALQILEEYLRVKDTWVSEDCIARVAWRVVRLDLIDEYDLLRAWHVVRMGVAYGGLAWFKKYMKTPFYVPK